MPISRVIRRFSALALAGLAGLAGCAAGPQLHSYHVAGQAVELKDVPFYPQDGDQGGPAGLAMMLAAGGVQVTPQQLPGLSYDADNALGSAAAMRSAAARYGRVAYVLASKQMDLEVVKQLQSSHPVLVLLHSGVLLKQWQYAVLIGVEPDTSTFILRSGSEQRKVLSYGDFLKAWRDSGYWAMLILLPAEIPPAATAADWSAAAKLIEQAGKFEAAVQAYTAATRRWTDDAEAWGGLGRSDYALHDLRGATMAFNHAVTLQPKNADFHYGLALALLDRQCADQAETEAGLALGLQPDPTLRAPYLQTRKEADEHTGPSVTCSLDEDGNRE